MRRSEIEFDDEYTISGAQLGIIIDNLKMLEALPINECLVKNINEQLDGIITQQKVIR